MRLSGSLKVWDFGAGQILKSKPYSSTSTDEDLSVTGIQCNKSGDDYYIIACGWNNKMRMYLVSQICICYLYECLYVCLCLYLCMNMFISSVNCMPFYMCVRVYVAFGIILLSSHVMMIKIYYTQYQLTFLHLLLHII